MRILLFSSTYAPNTGGVETVTRRLAQELNGRGHELLVVTNRYPRSLPSTEDIDGIRVVRRLYPNLLPSPGQRPLVTLAKQALSPPLAVAELAHLVRSIQRFRPEVVNVHYFSYPAAYALVAARLTRVPTVLSFHGSDVPGTPYPATYPWTARAWSRLASGITTSSEDLRGYLMAALGPRAVEVIPFGVDVGDAEPDSTLGEGPEEGFVLLPARLVEKKGVDVAIRAMAELGAEGRRTRLVIAGDGPLRRPLERLATHLSVASLVDFRGSVPPADVRRLMDEARFVVAPSRWEAYGMVALEAMAAGKAVVAGDRGGIAEIMVDGVTGSLFRSGDAAGLAATMRKFLDNPAQAREMGEQGRRRAAEDFTWTRVALAYESLFEAVTRRQPAIEQERQRRDDAVSTTTNG